MDSVTNYARSGRPAEGLPHYGKAYGGAWGNTQQVRDTNRWAVSLQRRRDRSALAGTARGAAKEPVKENAPMWARILANVAQVALVSIALYAFCTLMAAIELGWIL